MLGCEIGIGGEENLDNSCVCVASQEEKRRQKEENVVCRGATKSASPACLPQLSYAEHKNNLACYYPTTLRNTIEHFGARALAHVLKSSALSIVSTTNT